MLESVKKNLVSLLEGLKVDYGQDFPLKDFTSYKVGGSGEMVVFPRSMDTLKKVYAFCLRNSIPFYLLGGGANVIVSDNGVEGVVCITEKLDRIYLKGGKIFAECGVSLERLAIFAAERNISGFEFAYNIPGTVGGALIMNAGNNYGEFSDIVCSVDALTENFRELTFGKPLCNFGYRTSVFKRKRLIVLSAFFKGKEGRREEIFALMEKIKREREEKFPLEYPNAGSVFKRPKGYYAGKLIDDAGCGGLKVGDAMVSTKHKGFIVNLGNATAEDIKTLISLVQERVYKKFGVKLEREQIFFPEDLKNP